jgi:hypothetical protein
MGKSLDFVIGEIIADSERYYGWVSYTYEDGVVEFPLNHIDEELFDTLRQRTPIVIVHKGGKKDMCVWLRSGETDYSKWAYFFG